MNTVVRNSEDESSTTSPTDVTESTNALDKLIFDSICRHLAAMARAGEDGTADYETPEPFGMMKNLSKMVCNKILESATSADTNETKQKQTHGDAARVLEKMRESTEVLARAERELRDRFKSISSTVASITEHDDTTTDDLTDLHDILSRCQATLIAIQV